VLNYKWIFTHYVEQNISFYHVAQITNCKAVKIFDSKLYAKSSLMLTQLFCWPFYIEFMQIFLPLIVPCESASCWMPLIGKLSLCHWKNEHLLPLHLFSCMSASFLSVCLLLKWLLQKDVWNRYMNFGSQ
jgi:hypothetical protein